MLRTDLWESGLPALLLAAGATEEQVHHHHQRKFQRPPTLSTSPPVNASNVARLSADLVNRSRTNTQWYQATGAKPTIMIPWGGDWTFSEDAHIMFNNMDQILDYVNAHSAELNATMRYGTLDQYLDIVHGSGEGIERTAPSQLTLPVVEGDFFANDDDCCQANLVKKVHSCWSGYFSSFPALKLALRKLDAVLRHAEILSLLATPKAAPAMLEKWEAALGWGRHTQGILQHHDAITGTGGGACDAEYHQMLSNATRLCAEVLANATAELIQSPSPLAMVQVPAIPPAAQGSTAGGSCAHHAHGGAPGGYVDCSPKPGGEAECHKMGCCWEPSAAHPYCFRPAAANASAGAAGWPEDGTVLALPGAGDALTLVLANSLAWNRTDAVSVRIVSTTASMVLVDADGSPVPAQLAPPEPVNASLAGPGSHAERHQAWAAWAKGAGGAPQMSRLVFRARLPALGSSSFSLRQATEADASSDKVAVSTISMGESGRGFTISNSRVTAKLSAAGLLDSAQTGSDSELQLRQDLMLYWGNGGLRAPASNPDGSGGDGGSESDAYVFSPQGAAASLARLSPAEDRGFWWPNATAKPPREGSALSIKGPLMQEVSAVFAVGETKAWQGTRIFSVGDAEADGSIEQSYLVEALSSNQDLVSRFSTGLRTDAVLYADEAGWTERAQPPKLSFDSMQSKIGCNFHPTSAWAGVQSITGDGSLTMLTDRARAAASLSSGLLEYVLHRHATGGNGRGPSDGDPNNARGVVTLLAAADRASFLEAQARQPSLALRRAHPVAVLHGAGKAAPDWTPLASNLPPSVHLFTLGRRAFQQGTGNGNRNAYPSGGRQGQLRLQHIEQVGPNSAHETVDLASLFEPGYLSLEKMTERTLSLARRPDQVERRSWVGAGVAGEMRTPSHWKAAASNSSIVELQPLQIRSFAFSL